MKKYRVTFTDDTFAIVDFANIDMKLGVMVIGPHVFNPTFVKHVILLDITEEKVAEVQEEDNGKG